MNHSLETRSPPSRGYFSSFELLVDYIQSLPYGQEDLSWFLNLLTPQTRDNFAQLPWNVQWRIWLRHECQQQCKQQGDVNLIGDLDAVVVAVQGLVLNRSLVGDDTEHSHDLLLTTTHYHQQDNADNDDAWTKDFMLQHWSASQRYHVYRDVHKCWRNWDQDLRRNVDCIMRALDKLLLEGDWSKPPESETTTEKREDSPLAVLLQMKSLVPPLQVCRTYLNQQDRTDIEKLKGCLPMVDTKPPTASLDEFKTWIKSNLFDHFPNLENTNESLQELCKYLGNQGADSAAYQSVKSMENAEEIFDKAASVHVDEVATYQGLSLLRSATTPDFIPETMLNRVYKPLPRLESDMNEKAVCGIIESQLIFDKSMDGSRCPNLNALVVFIWDYILASTTKSYTSAEQDNVEEPDHRSDNRVLFNAIASVRSWLPLNAILPRYQFLQHLLFETDDKQECNVEGDSWKNSNRELLHRHSDSLRLKRTILHNTTLMVRILSSSPETQEQRWNLLFDKELCNSLHNLGFAFGFVLSVQTKVIFQSGNDPSPEIFQKVFMLCCFLNSMTASSDEVSIPSTLPPARLAWLFRTIGATATIPLGTSLSESVESVGPFLIQQYQQSMSKLGLQLSSQIVTDLPWLETYFDALIAFCQMSVWNYVESNSWCASIAHATFSFANQKWKVGRLWVTALASYLIKSESLDEGVTCNLSPLLHCLHRRMVEQFWNGETTYEGLALVLLDALAYGYAYQNERISCSLSCILRSSPPEALFRGVNLSSEIVDKVLNAFGTRDLESAGVIFLGVAVHLGESIITANPFISHDCLRSAQNFVGDCSNGCFGNEMTRISGIKDRVANSLADRGSAAGLKWWNKVFPGESQRAHKLVVENNPHLEQSLLELEYKIQPMRNGRKDWSSRDRSTPKEHRSRGNQSNKMRSKAASPFKVTEKFKSRKRLQGRNGVPENADLRPQKVFSNIDVFVDNGGKKQLTGENDNVILLDL